MKEEYTLEKLPGASYIPNYIEDPEKLFKLCEEEIEKNENTFRIAGVPGPIVASFHENEIPEYIKTILEKIQKDGIFGELKPFQVSINNYKTNEYSLSPHKDSKGAQAIIISLGSTIGLDFYHHPSNQYNIMIGYDDFGIDPDGYILMESGCLFDCSGDSFTKYLHGITQRKEDVINEKVLNRKYVNYTDGYIISKYLLENSFDEHKKKLILEQVEKVITKIDKTKAKNFLHSWYQKILKYFKTLTFEQKYILVGVLLGNLPDFDTFFAPLYGYKFHRTLTHSLTGNLIIVPVVSYAVQKFLKLKGFRGYLHSCWFSSLCIFSHIITDYVTNYGTSLYYPFNKKLFSYGTISVLDFTTILYFYFTLIVSRSNVTSNTRVFWYSTIGFFTLMLWKRSMYYEVFDKTSHLIQNVKKKYKNSNVWLQPSNFINGEYFLLRFDQKSKSTTKIKTVRSSPWAIISYVLEFLGLRKIDIRKLRTKNDDMNTLEKCAPREYLFSMYKENKALFYSVLKHSLPSLFIILMFNSANFYYLKK
eukprot:gene8123-12583_t